AYILTVIDTFTRFTLHWQVGYTMRTRQVKQAWEEIITDYLQSADLLRKGVHIEVRNDNGPQFGSKIIRAFFEENHLTRFSHIRIHLRKMAMLRASMLSCLQR
ncbi:MAG: hypothetical protein B6I32_06705, partial [Desulfobacterium sp. 4572_20]